MPKGYKPTEEHKRKISELLKGRHISPNTEFKKGHINIPWNKGKKMSKEIREKMSETQKRLYKEGKRKPGLYMLGKHHLEETKRKMSEKARGRNKGKHLSPLTEFKKGQIGYWNGKCHSEKTINKISETKKRLFTEGKIKSWNQGKKGYHTKPFTKETKEKISKTLKGHILSKETKNKISRTLFGRLLSKETKRKMSKAQKRIWQNPELKEKRIKATLKGLFKRPTSFEKKIIDLCSKHDLPFKYVGNGQVIINYVNPDFIETNGQKLIIETYAKWCHPKNYEETRAKRFATIGYKTLFLNDDDLLCKDWEEICLEKIKNFCIGAKQ